MNTIFDDLDKLSGEPDEILHAPFPYPGSKSKSISKITPRLPYRDAYIEPFGGSGAILLSRHSSKLEVFNDRYAGVVAFYRCLRDPTKLAKLLEWLDLTIHAREEFVRCKWEWTRVDDDVERAARWYYVINYSFGGLGRNFGRSTSSRAVLSGKIRNKLHLFSKIHERFKNVQVENQDFRQCMQDYDSETAVFYIDPPYVDAHRGTYKHEMTHDDHRELLHIIFNMQGFVAVSGYTNSLYDNHPWDNRFEWDTFVSISPRAFTTRNKKLHLKDVDERTTAKEVLWIKEAK